VFFDGKKGLGTVGVKVKLLKTKYYCFVLPLPQNDLLVAKK